MHIPYFQLTQKLFSRLSQLNAYIRSLHKRTSKIEYTVYMLLIDFAVSGKFGWNEILLRFYDVTSQDIILRLRHALLSSNSFSSTSFEIVRYILDSNVTSKTPNYFKNCRQRNYFCLSGVNSAAVSVCGQISELGYIA